MITDQPVPLYEVGDRLAGPAGPCTVTDCEVMADQQVDLAHDPLPETGWDVLYAIRYDDGSRSLCSEGNLTPLTREK